MEGQLFEGELIRLAPPYPEKDAETESRWTHDPAYLRLLDAEPAKPLSATQIKKKYEATSKDQGHTLFQFAVRAKADDRLIGFARLFRIEWNHGAGNFSLGIGAAEDRGKGFGMETLKLALNYAFNELNLHRVALGVFEHNPRARRAYEKAGFVLEGRVRGDCHRDGQRLNTLWTGILREEWEKQTPNCKTQIPNFEV